MPLIFTKSEEIAASNWIEIISICSNTVFPRDFWLNFRL